MQAIRWGITVALATFLLSLTLGMIAGNQTLRAFLTAFVFGLTFFGFGFGLRIMINNFFPELLIPDSQSETDIAFEEEAPKSALVIENTGEYAVPEMHRIPGKSPELGNIEELLSGNYVPKQESVDAKPEVEYNNIEMPAFLKDEGMPPEIELPSQPQVFAPTFTPSFGDDEGLGGLPDLDIMAMAFSGGADDSFKAPVESGVADNFFYNDAPEPVSGGQAEFEPDRSQYKGNKPQALEGDFDAKQIAQGIRTVLNKDNK